MNNRAMMTLTATAMLILLAAGASAAPTAEESCQASKLNALRKRSSCRAGERRKEILGKTPDPAKCEVRFAAAITRAGNACRWLVNGDGTATDLHSGLQWELKTDDGSVHDKDNTYTWNTTVDEAAPNGTVFTEFLGTLNGGEFTGTATTGCFAEECDWRLPTLEELEELLAEPPPHIPSEPDCAIDPCTTIPGLTVSSGYWTLSSLEVSPFPGEEAAYLVIFQDGWSAGSGKEIPWSARAVRRGF